MVSPALIAALREARARVPPAAWRQLSGKAETSKGQPDESSIREVQTGLVNPEAAFLLRLALERAGTASWPEIAAAMVAVDCLANDSRDSVELVWTGPTTSRLTVRRIDQVLYDLIAGARSRVLLVTFAAYRVAHLCDRLTEAVGRGVSLTLIAESEAESEGQLKGDALAAFRGVPDVGTSIFYWPLAKRERSQRGKPGKLHVKCAIVDDAAIISSANMTDDAFNRNMELGVLVRGEVVRLLDQHFDELIRTGALTRADE